MKTQIFALFMVINLVLNSQVTSVGISAPGSVFSISGSPVTTTGTLTLNFVTQTEKTFFAGPTSGSPATPVFRTILATDLPYVSASNEGIVSTNTASTQVLGDGDKEFPDLAFFTIGSESAPSLAFTSNHGSGFSYLNSSLTAYLSINGTYRFQFLNGQFDMTNGADFIGGAEHLNINIAHLSYLNDQDGGVSVSTYTDGNGHTCTFAGRTANGTESIPAASVQYNRLAEFSGKGHYGTNWDASNRGVYGVYASETHTSTAQGAYCAISTTAIGENSNHISMIINDKGNAGLTDQKDLTTSLPSGFGTAKTDHFFSIEASSNTKDAGLFIQNKNGQKGMNIWLDNSTDITYLDNIRDDAAGTVKLRLRTYSGSILTSMTANGYGTNFGGATPISGETFSVGSSADLTITALGKLSQYANSSPINGQLLIGNTSGGTFDAATLTPGTGVSITNSGGSITINSVPGAILGTAAGNNNIAASTTGFAPIVSTSSFVAATNENERQFVIPYAGTIKNLYVVTSNGQSATGTYVFTIRKNGTNTAMVVTITAGAGSGTFTDLSNTFTVAAGDLISMQAVNNATAPSAKLISWSVQVTQ